MAEIEEASHKEYIAAMEGMESARVNEDKLESMLASDSPPVIIDLRALPGGECYAGAVSIPMERLVLEVVREHVSSTDTTVVLVCNQSFEMSRMVALSSYAYPTLRLMGYTSVHILQTW